MKPIFIKCKSCGEKFLPTKEETELHNDGYADLPDKCDECFSMQENSVPEYESISDADSGL